MSLFEMELPKAPYQESSFLQEIGIINYTLVVGDQFQTLLESLNSASFGLVGKRGKKKKGGLAPPFCPLGHRLFLLSRCFWKAPWYSFYSFCNWCLVFVKGYVLAFLSLHGSCKKAKCKWPCQRRNVINVFVMLSKFLRNCLDWIILVFASWGQANNSACLSFPEGTTRKDRKVQGIKNRAFIRIAFEVR